MEPVGVNDALESSRTSLREVNLLRPSGLVGVNDALGSIRAGLRTSKPVRALSRMSLLSEVNLLRTSGSVGLDDALSLDFGL